MYNKFVELVKTRQSCREFNDQPVDKNEVMEIAELAMLSPSACNSQPWKMYVVTDEDRLNAVAESLQERGRNAFVSGAKAFIAVSEKQATLKPDIEKKFDRNHFVKYDIGELVAYLTLGAKAKGLETCIIGWINHDKLKTALGMPDGEVCNIVVAIGKSDIPVREKARKPKENIIYKV